MAKAPAKVSVECPHCGFKQMEYAAAKSTLCRQCGKHYVIGPAANEPRPAARETLPARPKIARVVRRPGSTPPAIKPQAAPAPVARPNESAAEPAAASSLLRRFGQIWNRTRSSSVVCFDCGTKQEITSAATSTICPSCSVHMDLRDYKIDNSFSRNLRTHGEVHITPTGDLNSTKVVCRSAIIDGKLRGSLHCVETAEFRSHARIHGQLAAGNVIIGKKADVQFFRQLHVGSIEIRGAMTGEIVATTVVIRRHGSLEGNVVARAINVEKGGRFSGQLMIGRQTLEQAELLPEVGSSEAPASTKKRGPAGGESVGLPATT